MKILMLILLASSVYAGGMCEFMKNEVEGKGLPGGIPYSNEVVNVYTLEEEKVGCIVLKDKKFNSVECSVQDEPTYNAYVKDLKTFEDIKASDDKIAEFKAKLSSKDIVLKGESIGKKIKLFFTKIVLKFL